MDTIYNVTILSWIINRDKSFFKVKLIDTTNTSSKPIEFHVFEKSEKGKDLYTMLEAVCRTTPIENNVFPLQTEIQVTGNIVSTPITITIGNDE